MGTGASKGGAVQVDRPATSLDAHLGLRGLAAVWIMVYHFVIDSTKLVDIQGSAVLPLFFLLSGFTIALVYSKEGEVSAGGDEEEGVVTVPAPGMVAGASEVDVSAGGSVDTTTAANQQNSVVEVSIQAPPQDLSRGPSTVFGLPIAMRTKQGAARVAPPHAFPLWSFLRNRVARVYPVYALFTILGIYVVSTGQGAFPNDLEYPTEAMNLITNFIPVTTWFGFIIGYPYDGPGWTVTTLFFFWIFGTSYFLKWAERTPSDKLVTAIVRHQWIQLIALYVLLVGVGIMNPVLGFAFATMWPVGRLPIYLMGLYAGVIVKRHQGGMKLPWISIGCGGCGYRGSCCGESSEALAHQEEAEGRLRWSAGEEEVQTRKWAQVADNTAKTIIGTFVGWTVADVLVKTVGGGDGAGGLIVLQSYVPLMFLNLVVALVRDRGTSKTSMILRSRVVQWLGNLSMCIYLVHYPLMELTRVLEHGDAPWPTEWGKKGCGDRFPQHDDPDAQVSSYWLLPGTNVTQSAAYGACVEYSDVTWPERRTVPVWGVFGGMAASMVVAWATYHVVEVPCRRLLRTRK